MKRFYLIITILFVGVSALWSQHANVIWNTPSHNSSESMPCGGGDIGMNIWVEDGDVMFYVSRSGTFDENNCQLKQGRVRLRLSPNPFKDAKDFRQELKLKDGYVEIAAGNTQIQFWVDVFHPIIHVEVTNAQPLQTEVFYENWRYQERPVRKGEGQQCSYKWAPPKGTVTESDFISLDKITDSTSAGRTFCPPTFMTSLLLPMIFKYPSSSSSTKSPVLNQPSLVKLSIEAFKYPKT